MGITQSHSNSGQLRHYNQCNSTLCLTVCRSRSQCTHWACPLTHHPFRHTLPSSPAHSLTATSPIPPTGCCSACSWYEHAITLPLSVSQAVASCQTAAVVCHVTILPHTMSRAGCQSHSAM